MVGSFRSLSQTLETVFSSETTSTYELSDAVQINLKKYVASHTPINPQSGARLQNELKKIHKKSQSDTKKECLFLRCLDILAPCLYGEETIRYWFQYYYRPAVESAGYSISLVKASRAFILSVMTHGYVEDSHTLHETTTSNDYIMTSWLLDIYLEQWQEWDFSSPGESIESYNERKRYIRMNAQNLLVECGLRRTRLFATKLNEKFVLKKFRIECLVLLSVLINRQPKELHQLEKTSLLDNLLECLSRDFSTAALTICCTTFSMILPYVTKYMTEKLHAILASYGRLASWSDTTGQAFDVESDEDITTGDEEDENFSDTWQVLDYSFNIGEKRPPAVLPLFMVLYGLFPSNLMKFVRAPGKYLTAAIQPLPKNFWDEFSIKEISTSFFELFTLNPLMIRYTAKEELSDSGRFASLGSTQDILAHSSQFLLGGELEKPEKPQDIYTAPFTDIAAMLNDAAPELKDRIVSEQTSATTVSKEQRHDSPSSFKSLEHSVSPSYIESPSVRSVDSLLEDHKKVFNKNDTSVKSEALPAISEFSLDTDTQNPGRTFLGAALSRKTSSDSPKMDSTGRRLSIDYSPRTGAVMSPGFGPQGEISHPETHYVTASPSMDPISRTSSNARTLASSGSGRGRSLTQTGASSGVMTDPTDGDSVQYEDLAGQISFYSRELLLIKNELEFVTLIERHGQYRYKKLKKQVTKQAMSNERGMRVLAKNKQLKAGNEILRQEVEKTRKNSQKYRNEHQAYEAVLIGKNKEFRSKVNELKEQLEKLETEMKTLKQEKQDWETSMLRHRDKISELEVQCTYERKRGDSADSYLRALEDARNQLSFCRTRFKEEDVEGLVPAQDLEKISADLEKAKLSRQALENDYNQLKQTYEKKLVELRDKVASGGCDDELLRRKLITSPGVAEIVEKMKQAASKQHEELKKAYEELKDKYQNLDERFQAKVIENEELITRYESSRRSSVFLHDHSSSSEGLDRANSATLLASPAPEMRIRGRGGVQNSVPVVSKKASRNNFRGLNVR